MVKSGVTGTGAVCAALEMLKEALRQHGLDSVNVTISSHGLTREQSERLAGAILAGGFGQEVRAAGRPVRYQGREGWFSWFTVEQDSDVINLFFNLDEDDLPIDYLPTEKEAS
ncbi:MAG TPA: hypothetical protein GXZ25_12350 [Peptococcaceae bacterium]|nr:hypothetical protein [Peptococcaceae bacterium]